MNFKQPIGGEKIHDPLAPATGVLSYSLLLAKQLLSWFTVKKLLERPNFMRRCCRLFIFACEVGHWWCIKSIRSLLIV